VHINVYIVIVTNTTLQRYAKQAKRKLAAAKAAKVVATVSEA
jgi:hypothetical protein